MHSEFDAIIYTDGACETNPGPGGWAALLTSGTRRKTLSGGYRRTTNNRMELRAVIEALRAIKGDRRRVKIVSDSRYVTEAVNQRWLDKWAAKGFRKGDGLRENSDLWVELRALLARHPVTFQWIKGHAEHPENEACDQLAVAARQAKELPADLGFEDPPARHAALGRGLIQLTARALFADFIPP
jgi:ribonuclease HI